jgi:hypothetical protein
LVRNFAAVTLSNGILPHWNPYTFGGMPFIADIQTAVFYPLHLLLTLFVTKGELPFAALTYSLVFHYFMAGVFSYYMARSLDLSKWASVLCGITFMFCGFMVTSGAYETFVNPFTYMPLIFMFYNNSLNTSKLKYILLTGLFMGIVILCGHPQITFYIFFIFLIFGLYQIFFKFKDNGYKIDIALVKFIAIAIVPFVIGIMLGAIQLLPTMTLSELSVRAEMAYEHSVEGYINYYNLISLFTPKFFGYFSAMNAIEYWGGSVQGDSSQHLYLETCMYMGLPALIFGMFGIIVLWKKRMVKFLALISLFAVLYILGDNFILHKFFYNFIPGFDKFRCIGRFRLLFTFGFSLLGAYGFNYFINSADSDKVKKFIKCFVILVLSFILLWVLYMAGIFENLVEEYKYAAVIEGKVIPKMWYKNSVFQLTITVGIFLALFSIIVLYKKKIIPRQISLFLFVLLVFTDLYIFGSEQNSGTRTPESYFVYRETAAAIKQEYKREVFRLISEVDPLNMFFQRNQGMLDFIFLMDGITPLSIKDKFPPFRTNELMNVKYIAVYDTVNSQVVLKLNEFYGARAWMSYQPIVESSLEKVSKILEDPTFDITRKVIIDQEPEIPINTNRTEIVNRQIQLESYEINEITLSVETSENGILVLSEVYYPNWKVFVNGIEKPILRCHYSLRGVALERGGSYCDF